MKRLVAAAISSTFLLGMTPTVHAQPREEVITEYHCDVQERIYVVDWSEKPTSMVGAICDKPIRCQVIRLYYANGSVGLTTRRTKQ